MNNYFHFRLRFQSKDGQKDNWPTDRQTNRYWWGFVRNNVSKTNLGFKTELIIWDNKYFHFNNLPIHDQVQICYFNIVSYEILCDTFKNLSFFIVTEENESHWIFICFCIFLNFFLQKFCNQVNKTKKITVPSRETVLARRSEECPEWKHSSNPPSLCHSHRRTGSTDFAYWYFYFISIHFFLTEPLRNIKEHGKPKLFQTNRAK